ncbi:MAG: phospho-sugar mutase, partial [Lachnospiraceae bacterium]|nr:phospho-sugar mutase [Lachnospiraceae bacterium]
LGCIAGINVTASHNPPEYNGYKVYWEDGAQITPPHDSGIMSEVKAITDLSVCKTMSKEDAEKAGLFVTIGKEVDDTYIAELKKLVLHQDCIDKYGKDIKIVYTPLHGTGNIPARRVLKEIGFENVYVVPEQELPDPDFTTLEYPNPEDPKAFTLALKLAREVKADVVLATDPDADRLGIYSYDTKTDDYVAFTGNMSGMLIAEYILRERTKLNIMPEKPALIKTIVTTNMADPIAEKYNVKLIEVLTGFKYIGEQIKWFEQNHTNNYVFGLEESYGCLAGTHARDKDAIVAVMCLCEVAAWCKKNGITLWDQMMNIYNEYGFFKEDLYTITLKGMDGSEKIKEMMTKLRNNPPKKLGDWDVVSFRDYDKDEVLDIKTGAKKPTGLPKSNVLYFDLTDNAWCCARPSGTEPKIKFYMGVKGSNLDDAKDKLTKLTEALKAVL